MDTPIHLMTPEQALAEWRKWTKKIEKAKGWGASLAAAAEFRDEAATQYRRLTGKDPK